MSELDLPIASPETGQNLDLSRFKRFGRLILHPVETFRTAPLGMISEGLSSTMFIGTMVEAAQHPAVWEVPDGVMFAAWMYMSAVLVNRQLRIRDRVERNVEKNGFDERFFEPLTDEWCNRQTVEVALESTEYLDQYRQLCEKRSATAEFRELPHF